MEALTHITIIIVSKSLTQGTGAQPEGFLMSRNLPLLCDNVQ